MIRGSEERRVSAACRIVGVLPKSRLGMTISLAVLTRDGRAPLLSIGFARDGRLRGHSEFTLEDLPLLERAIAEVRSAADSEAA